MLFPTHISKATEINLAALQINTTAYHFIKNLHVYYYTWSNQLICMNCYD